MRKGYFSEHKAETELIERYGKDHVVKIATKQSSAGFIIWNNKKIIKVIEVKEVHGKYCYLSKREKLQIKKMIKFADKQRIKAELWIYKYHKRGRNSVIKTIKFLN